VQATGIRGGGGFSFAALAELIERHRRINEQSGGANGLRDLGLAESALFQSQMAFGGTELYATLAGMRKTLLHILLYQMFVSDLVIAECGDGDNEAACERLEVIEGIAAIRTTDDAKRLAADLLAARAVPQTEPRDALHIALAAIHGMNYLATWNFRHIMNPATQHLIEAVCRAAGIESVVICTPEQLLVTYDDP